MKTAGGSGGFTLVEIAIVLVVVGLLLGGILKGQEMINNAKVRSIADRQVSLKVAWHKFVDRFGGLPGDYELADSYIAGTEPGDGDGAIDENEAPLAFQHLTAAGYLRCAQCTQTRTSSGITPTAANSLVNNYGGVMSIWDDATHYAFPTAAHSHGVANTPRLMSHTGPRIPSNILAEVDRKIDDGVPNTGDMRFNRYDPTGAEEPAVAECTKTDAAGGTAGSLPKTSSAGANFWRPAQVTPPVYGNCGASIFI
ncbi:MAG: prepilin-type N-terminal cleavage/methylation domain-containing protein [Betaproteobacteria bacterium AqS2]|uniref:Prepilin-type N-terminal cleavage/methylation domain-containing protein n=1 Tax=Candidatus Amphirhobacter heronislandensis TaxID=1732024 RepID=A0A930XYH4_9GAMM|nr:prepilin-type N-terminal cleavage/methylation domain-containing protein [Betaproteobacteria bacterium AqS2]